MTPASAPSSPGEGFEHASPGIERDRIWLRDSWDRIRRVCRATRAIADREIERIANPEDGIYGIPSFEEEGLVYSVSTKPVLSCTCPDAAYRQDVCKHIAAALLIEGDWEAMEIAKWVDFLPRD